MLSVLILGLPGAFVGVAFFASALLESSRLKGLSRRWMDYAAIGLVMLSAAVLSAQHMLFPMGLGLNQSTVESRWWR